MGRAAKGHLVAPSGETILSVQRSVLCRAGIPHVLVGEHPAYVTEGIEILRDDPRAPGPLGGMLSLLDRAGDGLAIALACDMPFVDDRALRSLLEAPAAPAVAPRRAGCWEPFFARYHATVVLPIAVALAESGVHSLQALLHRAGTRELAIDSDRALIDWDTPEDIGASQLRASSEQQGRKSR